jgi:methylphosphotriester-DNA--protein-cysteine methyltransferase
MRVIGLLLAVACGASLLVGLFLPKPPPEDARPRAAAEAWPSRHASARGADARAKPYVASARSDVYHRADCRHAARIAERNLLGYDTRADAEADDRRPCKICRPATERIADGR